MADASIDPDRFDAIVLGTGLPESILAAAAASSGRKVLHLDSSGFYGSEWASLPLDQLQSFLESLGASNGALNPVAPIDLGDGSGLEEIELWRDGFLYCDGRVRGSSDELGASRGYSLDLAAPKVLFCAGSLVDALVKCGASNYLEFKAMQGTYVWKGDGVVPAPTSSSDLFQDRSMGLRDKRRMMRFLKSVQAYLSREDAEGAEDAGDGFREENLKVSFVEMMEREQLPELIQSIILYAVALLDEDQRTTSAPVSALEGLQLLKLHMSSIGRYDTGAFLYPLYGQGELPQAFCRVAAVHGALYVLRRPVSSLIFDKETKQYKGVRTQSGQLLYSDKIILGATYSKWARHALEKNQSSDVKMQSLSLGRYVCITDASLLSAKNNILLIFPPRTLSGEWNPNPVRVLQLSSNIAACPDGKFVIHISTIAGSESFARDVLDKVLQLLLIVPGTEDDLTSIIEPESVKPKLLWSGFFTEKLHSTNSQVIGNQIGICAQPGPEAEYISAVDSTKKMFHELFGPEDWFARKPEAELEENETVDH